jgi:hypothetical protein
VYEVGDAVRLSWRVLDHARELTDATVTATLVTPGGISSPLTVERVSLGAYATTVVPTVVGRHVVRWRATDEVTASQTDVLNVASALEPVALISLDELKAFLNKDDLVEDDELREFIDTASLVVEEYTGQVWARRTLTEEVYVIGGVGYLRPPVVTVTAVTALDGTELDVPTSDAINGFTGAITGLADGWVTVTYTAGPTEVPEHVQTATAIIAAHLWTTQRPAAPAAPGFGGAETVATVPGRGYLIPNQAAQLLGGKAANRP